MLAIKVVLAEVHRHSLQALNSLPIVTYKGSGEVDGGKANEATTRA
jgi:hypothetical protein